MMECHTPEQRTLYERGYPYLVQLVDGHKDDKKPAESAAKVFREYYGVYHVKWPRLTAAAFVGGSAEAVPDKVVAGLFDRRTRGNFNEVQHRLFVLEALTSTDAVLDAVVRGLEGLPEMRWMGKSIDPYDATDDVDPSIIAYLSGFLLLRSKKAAAYRKRLEALYDATVKSKAPEGEHGVRGGLDLALHGNDGALRALAKSHWQYWYYYLNVDDATVHLARLANNWMSVWVPEARILFLAGEKMLPMYTTKKALRQGKRLPHILGDFGMFAHDGVLDLMISMIGVKGAGDAPRAYFSANAAYAKPKLERIARGSGPNAVKAKAALALC
jgi:hypothetical protein